MEDAQIRELEDELLSVLNRSQLPFECKRVVLALLATKCELQANLSISISNTITEKGEMEDGTGLD